MLSLITMPHRKCMAQSCLTLCHPMDYSWSGSTVHGILQTENTGIDSHSLLQGFFRTLGSNLGLPYCRQMTSNFSFNLLVSIILVQESSISQQNCCKILLTFSWNLVLASEAVAQNYYLVIFFTTCKASA